MPHYFYDESGFIDLRYLVFAEAWEDEHEDDDDIADPIYGIGFVCEVGSTPQRGSFTYRTRARRDGALEQLLAAHQAWMLQMHEQVEEED